MEETDYNPTAESLSDPEDVLEENATRCEMPECSTEISKSFSRKRSESFSKKLESYKKPKRMSETYESSHSVILDESCVNSPAQCSSKELIEILEDEDTFKEALELLSERIKHNRCTESNVFDFYICIHSVRSQFLRLVEKRDELDRKDNRDFILDSCALIPKIEEVFHLYKEKVWRYFSPTQRKDVDLWMKHFNEWKGAFFEDFRSCRTDSDEFNGSVASDPEIDASPEERIEIPSEEEQIDLEETELEAPEVFQKKQVIFLMNCVLYPPDVEISIGEKPFGCRTIIVSNLPEKITRQMIEDIFGLCGTIRTIWQPCKRFCHIQYTDSIFAENAVNFSGYRLKIFNRDENPYCSVLHIAYLCTKDNHLDRIFDEQSSQIQNGKLVRSPSTLYLKKSRDKLKNKLTFHEAINRLITWLEREDCGENNTDFIFSIFEATNEHVKHLLAQKDKIEEEFSAEHRDHGSLNREETFKHCEFIFKIYEAALSQKCQNNFTKEERENIKAWKKQVEVLRNSLKEKQENRELREAVNKLKKERDFLKRQLAAAEEEKRNLQRFFEEEIRLKDLQYQRSLDELNYLRFNARLHLARQEELRRMQEEERSRQEAVPDSTNLSLESRPSHDE